MAEIVTASILANSEVITATLTSGSEQMTAIINVAARGPMGPVGSAELDELSDVSITSAVAGQALMRGASLWINRSLVIADISDATTSVPFLAAASNTFTGLASFTSTTRPTSSGTGTPAATSLITLNDQGNEFLRKVNKYSEHEINTFTTAMLTTIGGTAGSSSTTGGADSPAWSFRPSTTVALANNYQALVGPYLQLSNGSNRSTKNWSKRNSLSLRINNPANSSGTVRYYWGPVSSTWAGGTLAVKGIGFEIVNNSVFATCHNGTTKTTSATGVALSLQIFYAIHIESDGVGGVRWWVDNTEQTALTGGPTGNSGTSQYGFCTEAINPDPATGTFVNIHYLRLASVN